jgi:4'-phosphopantetheinyl transferase
VPFLAMVDSLKPGDVHVWYLWPERLANAERLSRHTQILSRDEKTRAQSFRLEDDRNLYILGKAFVRILLSRYAPTDPALWEFTPNEYGKPAISGPPGVEDIAFNISHTTGLISAVFALDASVGIDAEHHGRRTDALAIAEHFLSPDEYSALSMLRDSDRQQRFFEYWTLKEAYIKATGLGMSMDLSTFTFDIREDDRGISLRSANVTDPGFWTFRLLKPGPHHTVAVAIRRSGEAAIRFGIYDGNSLMK